MGSINRAPNAVGSYLNTNLIVSLILSIVFAAVLYLVSWLINTKKLNME